MTTDNPALQPLIEQGQALVRSLALKIARTAGTRIDLEDLIAYGQIGLAEAARDYHPGRGGQFTSYAYYRIRGAIYDGLSKMSWHSRARHRRLRQAQLAEEVLREINESPELTENGTLARDVKWFRRVTERLAVVYLSSASEGEGGLDDEVWEDPAAAPPVEVASREIGQKLRELIDTLPPEEQRLIRKIYFDGVTLQEAATALGISKSWASRLHAKTLGQLAAKLRRVGVRDAS